MIGDTTPVEFLGPEYVHALDAKTRQKWRNEPDIPDDVLRTDKGMPNWTGVFTHKQFSDILAFLHTV